MTRSRIREKLVREIAAALPVPKMMMGIDNGPVRLQHRLIVQSQPLGPDRKMGSVDDLHR